MSIFFQIFDGMAFGQGFNDKPAQSCVVAGYASSALCRAWTA